MDASLEDLREPFRQSRLKFGPDGGTGLLEALDKPPVRKSLELHARVLRDKLAAAHRPAPSEPKPAAVALPPTLTGRQLFEAMRDVMLRNNHQGDSHAQI